MKEIIATTGKTGRTGTKVGPMRVVGPVLSVAVLLTGAACYIPLLGGSPQREALIIFFKTHMAPAALAHAALLVALVLLLRLGARGALCYWGVSAAALLLIAGGPPAAGILQGVAVCAFLAVAGSVASRFLLPESSRGWGVSLAFGIIAASAAGSYLALFHVFRGWALALCALITTAWIWRQFSARPPAGARGKWQSFETAWNLPFALALEGGFLLGVYVLVAALAPETNSDAMRFYQPYARLLTHTGGFFDAPFQWSYVIPQAGLTFAAMLQAGAGEFALRIAMPAAWAALVGIACRPRAGVAAEIRVSVALIMASCPVFLWTATSLMQDAFVSLAVVVLAVVCLEGGGPGSFSFGCAVGAAAGICWCAKFSTLPYVAPLTLAAAWRGIRAAGWRRGLGTVAAAGASALAVLVPWLIHSYRQTGNPVFPFFRGLLPSPLWPSGVGFANLESFRLPPGWKSWLLWPLEMTYRTSRYVEGADGKLGLALLVLLVLAVAAAWRGTWASRILIAAGLLGTALLCSQTAYVRYWIPGLWLLAMAAPAAFPAGFRSRPARILVLVPALLLLACQVLFSMFGYWAEPKGWPWDVFAGSISREAYIARNYPGFGELSKREEFRQGWPPVWFTNYEAVGHLPVLPMEATIWELDIHALEPREKVRYLGSTGCRYWLVDEAGPDAVWIRNSAISHFYWDEQMLLARFGTFGFYRMKSAAEAVREFDARAAAGSELLLDSGMEIGEGNTSKFWRPEAGAAWVRQPAQAYEGNGCFRMPPGSGLRQDAALPPGLKALEFAMASRCSDPGKTFRAHLLVSILGFDQSSNPRGLATQMNRDLSGLNQVVEATQEWTAFRSSIPVPEGAVYCVVHIANVGTDAQGFLDGVHLYSR